MSQKIAPLRVKIYRQKILIARDIFLAKNISLNN